MSYSLISLASLDDVFESEFFIEGAVLAANISREPLDPKTWVAPLFPDAESKLEPMVVEHIHAQYQQLKTSAYSILNVLPAQSENESLADFAEGFMSVWSYVEQAWQQASLTDGTQRMLQALLTTMMLAIDEEQTQQQMKLAGIDNPPSLDDLLPQLDLMISEVALSADEALTGGKSQSVNPYKQVGRNDLCPCGSGKKFKQCCGNS